MSNNLFLLDLFYYFSVTSIAIPFFKLLGLGSTLGYLISGILLGPYGLGLHKSLDNIENISNFGIIMLMFAIGLELSPTRLKQLKKNILFEGGVQFLLTSLIFLPIIYNFVDNWTLSIFISSSLALSSTALTLSWLKEGNKLTTSYGQSSVGILIFQDLLIIPILTLVPLFSEQGSVAEFQFSDIASRVLIIGSVFFVFRYIVVMFLDKIYKTQAKEVFVGSCLMLITGASLIFDYVGLSKAIGALVAGIFLSGSKLKSDIQNFSIPIKSMAMGIFFFGFGLSFDLSFIKENLISVSMLTLSLMVIKSFVLLLVGLLSHRRWRSSAFLALLLCQGGEFGLLVIAALVESFTFSMKIEQYLMSCIALSIFVSPFLSMVIPMFSKEVPIRSVTKTSESEEVKNPIPLKKSA